MICNNCGTEVPDDLKKCIFCGAELEVKIQSGPATKKIKPKTINDQKKLNDQKKPVKRYVRIDTPKDQEKKTGLVIAIVIVSIILALLFIFIGIVPIWNDSSETGSAPAEEQTLPVETELASSDDENADVSSQLTEGTTENDQEDSQVENTQEDNADESSQEVGPAIVESEYDIYLDSNEDSIQLEVGESREIILAASGEDLPERFSISTYTVGDSDHIEWVWGGWIDNNTATVIITGLTEGEGRIRYTLNDYEDSEKVYADTYVDLTVIPRGENDGGSGQEGEIDEAHYLVSSVDSLHLSIGESQEIMISAEGTDLPDTFYFNRLGSGIVSSEWGEWVSDNTAAITITGEVSGRVKLKFIMYDNDTDEEIAYTYVDIVVE